MDLYELSPQKGTRDDGALAAPASRRVVIWKASVPGYDPRHPRGQTANWMSEPRTACSIRKKGEVRRLFSCSSEIKASSILENASTFSTLHANLYECIAACSFLSSKPLYLLPLAIKEIPQHVADHLEDRLVVAAFSPMLQSVRP